MPNISGAILEKGRKLVEEKRVFKDMETDRRTHFKVLGDSEVHIVIYDKLKGTYDCDCSWSTLKRKLCSHIIGCKILNGEMTDASTPPSS